MQVECRPDSLHQPCWAPLLGFAAGGPLAGEGSRLQPFQTIPLIAPLGILSSGAANMSRIAIAVALLVGALCVAAKDPKVTNKVWSGCGVWDGSRGPRSARA